VINEGDDDSVFYIIISGEASAQKQINGVATEVRKYKQGDYFGELALLKNAKRAASVIATS
jgi:cAMP-dependent protein kinase regulator